MAGGGRLIAEPGLNILYYCTLEGVYRIAALAETSVHFRGSSRPATIVGLALLELEIEAERFLDLATIAGT